MDSNNVPPPPDSQSPPEPPPPVPPAPPEAAPAPLPGGSTEEPALGVYISEAWNLVLAEPVLLILGYVVLGAIASVSIVVVIGPLLLAGPLMVGYYQVIQKRLNGEPATFEDLFAGFHDFVRAMVGGLLMCAFWFGASLVTTIAGFILQAIPCLGTIVSIVLALAVSLVVIAVTFFLMPMVALSRIDPVEATQRNLAFAMAEIKPMVLLSLVFLGLHCAGAVACVVGLLVAGPMAMVVQVLAYNRYYLKKAGGAS